MKTKNNIGKFAKWGIIGYLLALPIMVWKSSKVGKIIFVCIMVTFFLGVFGKVGDVFFLKWRYRIVMDREVQKLQGKIEELNRELNDAHYEIQILDIWLIEQKNTYNEKINKKIENFINGLDNRVVEVTEALDLIKKTEQESLLSQIDTLKERVCKHKKDIYDIEQKKIIEEISDDMFILLSEDRERVFQDLKNLKYKVEKINEKSHKIYLNPRPIVTNDSN